MQLLSRQAHNAKSAAEGEIMKKMNAAFTLGDPAQFEAPPNGLWNGGKLSGRVLEVRSDGRLRVQVDMTTAFFSGTADRTQVILYAPLAGIAPVGVDSIADYRKLASGIRGQPILIALHGSLSLPLRASALANVQFGGAGNLPPATVSLKVATKNAPSFNVQVLQKGVAKLDDDAVKQLPKKTAQRLLAAQKVAKNARIALWKDSPVATPAAAPYTPNSDESAGGSANYGYYSGGGSGGNGGTSGGGLAGGAVHVNAYTRSDGTQVRGYDRAAPSSRSGSGRSGGSGFGGGGSGGGGGFGGGGFGGGGRHR